MRKSGSWKTQELHPKSALNKFPLAYNINYSARLLPWTGNYIYCKACDKVWPWVSKFISQFTGHVNKESNWDVYNWANVTWNVCGQIVYGKCLLYFSWQNSKSCLETHLLSTTLNNSKCIPNIFKTVYAKSSRNCYADICYHHIYKVNLQSLFDSGANYEFIGFW